MSYVSPIKIGYEAEPEEGWTDKIGKYIAGEVDNLVLQSCVKVGCHVDKDELEKALRYDRDQYVKGYEDGKRDVVVRCRECKHYDNPQKCIVAYVAKLKGEDRFLLFDADWFCADGKRKEQELSWRTLSPTQKQLDLIAEMQEFSYYPLPKFDGKTRGEASDYINKWGKLAHESVNQWASQYI